MLRKATSSRSKKAKGVSSNKQRTAQAVFQLKITLKGYKPLIWRRVQIEDCTLDKLHEHIQTAMGWTNSHLHHFHVGKQLYGDPELMQENFEDMGYKDSTRTMLSQIVPTDGKRFKFSYEYDFGDSWDRESESREFFEKFSPKGTFLDIIGTKGSGQGQFGAPNGIAVDSTGNIYVADAGNHRVQKLGADGKLVAEWRGPGSGFYGPRRIAIGADDSVYVMDQGRTRVVKFGPDGQVLTVWGSKGTGDGQFDDPASVAVDPTGNKVYVADPRNKRIQVFDSDGKFVTKWIVPEWGGPYGFEDLAIDSNNGRLYASSANINAVLVFDLNGNRVGALTPKPPEQLGGPTGLALVDRKLYVVNMGGNHVSVIDL